MTENCRNQDQFLFVLRFLRWLCLLRKSLLYLLNVYRLLPFLHLAHYPYFAPFLLHSLFPLIFNQRAKILVPAILYFFLRSLQQLVMKMKYKNISIPFEWNLELAKNVSLCKDFDLADCDPRVYYIQYRLVLSELNIFNSPKTFKKGFNPTAALKYRSYMCVVVFLSLLRTFPLGVDISELQKMEQQSSKNILQISRVNTCHRTEIPIKRTLAWKIYYYPILPPPRRVRACCHESVKCVSLLRSTVVFLEV